MAKMEIPPPQHPWMRQPNEGTAPYEAFRVYLNQGAARSHPKVCEEVGKSRQLITDWSAKWNWVERCRAFDVHLEEARTDGLVHQLSESRDKNLALMDKLRDHLSSRLDNFITRNVDPSMLWTQALTAMARVEQNSLLLTDKATSRHSVGVARVESLVKRFEELVEAGESAE